MSARRRLSILAAAILLTAIPPRQKKSSLLLAQDLDPRQPRLRHEVSVTVKLIQVFITDKRGNSVPGLTREDFAVFDDGHPVTITEFEKHELPPPPAGTAKEATPAASRPPAAPAAKLINRKFFLFLDFAYNSQKGAAKAVQAAAHFLQTRVQPGDEVALLSASFFKGVTVHEYLTADYGKVLEALESLNAKEIAGRADEIEASYWRQFDGGEVSPLRKRELQFLRSESKVQAENYMKRLIDLAKSLRLVSGNKNFILFSTGIPASLVYGWGARGPYEVGDPRLRPLYEDLVKEFSNSNCVFYVFDTRESTKIPALFTDEEVGISSFNASRAGGVFQDDRTTGLDSLKRIADRTGGKFFSNLNRYENNLAKVEELTRAYYVLGYPLSEIRDGRFHEIKVEVGRKGCRVRAPAGYFNPKPYGEFTKLERDLQLYDLALNERAPLETPKAFPIEALAYDAGSGPSVRMLASLDKETLESLAGKSVEFIALVFDGDGNLIDLQRTERDVAARPGGGQIRLNSGPAATAGRCQCRLVIRNLETGASAVASTEADMAEPASRKVSLYSPLLVTSASAPANLEWGRSEKPDRLAWRDIYPYNGLGLSPLLGAAVSADDELTAIVPYSVVGLDEPSVVISASLIEAETGRNLPLRLSPLQNFRRGLVESQILGLNLEGVPPGRYLLDIHAEDTIGKSSDRSQVPLTIQGLHRGNQG